MYPDTWYILSTKIFIYHKLFRNYERWTTHICCPRDITLDSHIFVFLLRELFIMYGFFFNQTVVCGCHRNRYKLLLSLDSNISRNCLSTHIFFSSNSTNSTCPLRPFLYNKTLSSWEKNAVTLRISNSKSYFDFSFSDFVYIYASALSFGF